MKGFLLKCALFTLLLSIIFVPFGMIVDPYNVFHKTNIVNNGVEPNKNFVKMNNVLNNPDKFDSFLFGSSRVGFFDPALLDDGVYYNMSYSEGVPKEHLENLKIMISRGIVPKNVTIGIDDIAYFVDPSDHDKQLYRRGFPWDGNFFDKLDFYLHYFDLITLSESLEVILTHENTDPEYGARLLSKGTENLHIKTEFNAADVAPAWSDYYRPREEIYDELREIIALCDEYDIRLRFFTNPINGYTYAKDIANGYLVFLKDLAEVTEYYNFSGFNDITMDFDYYYETSHFDPRVSNMIIDRVYHGKVDPELEEQGFGFHVTKDNVDELLEVLYAQAVNFALPTNTYEDIKFW